MITVLVCLWTIAICVNASKFSSLRGGFLDEDAAESIISQSNESESTDGKTQHLGIYRSVEDGQSVFEVHSISSAASPSSDNLLASLSFTPFSQETGGFDQLTVRTGLQDNVSNEYKMVAAGFGEGFVTAQRIAAHSYNVFEWLKQMTPKNETEKTMQSILTWLEEQDTWMMEQIESKQASDEETEDDAFWESLQLIMKQFEGLVRGYNYAQEVDPSLPLLSRTTFLVLCGIGELFDVLPAVSSGSRKDHEYFMKLDPVSLRVELENRGHCSGFIRVAGDLSDIMFGHSSWFVYPVMVRIYKHYDWSGLTGSWRQSSYSSLSSYPGTLESVDDFYMLGSGLAVIQTTNGIFNMSLYDDLTPSSVLAWQRVLAANLISSNGKDWADALDTHNSGTYNNQYMVLNLNLFEAGKPLKEGLLWVAEQIPGLILRADVTQILEFGHWPSFNIPFFNYIYEVSGYKEVMEQQERRGEEFADVVKGLSYQLAPRAQIFRRDAGTVQTMDDMMNFMRYNEYKIDPYAEGNPWSAICARGDLLNATEPYNLPPIGRASGCTDSKLSNVSMFWERKAYAVNGPTYDDEYIKPFQWSTSGLAAKSPHKGQPDIFNFKYKLQQPFVEEEA